MGNRKKELDPKISFVYDAEKERSENYIGRRIADARRMKNYSQGDLSTLLEKCGVSITTRGLRKWESGETVPSAYQLMALCTTLEINDCTGFFIGSPAQALNEAGMKKLQEYKDDLIATGRYRAQTKVKNNIVYIDKRISLLPASAGPGAFLDEENFELVSFPEASVPANADFGVRVSGDSMEPAYHDGQIAWVQRCNELLPGEVGLFLYDGDGYIKVYDEQEPDDICRDSYLGTDGVLHMQPVLVSYNEKYEPKVVSPELSFMIAGRILN